MSRRRDFRVSAMAAAADAGPTSVIVHVDARAALRTLRPIVRVVLEDVALDAVRRDSQLVAPTSARLVAEHLGVDAGTVASALRVLREHGVVELAQSTGPGGRFGLAVYTLHLPAGIEVIGSPYAGRPHAVTPDTADAGTVNDVVESPALQRRRSAPSPRRGEQGALDLGLGTR